jgi:hypothetical protein
MILMALFDGKCETHLLHKAKGLVQKENPYGRAMAIAKFIYLVRSVLNLSGYHQLQKGDEANTEGHVARKGGCTLKKSHAIIST